MSYKVVVAISGQGSNMLALGTALSSEPSVELGLVVSDRDAVGLRSALDQGLAIHRLEDCTDAEEWLRVLDTAEADLLVLAGYLRLIPARVVASYRGRIINIHPALLPLHGGPGMYGIRVHRAVLNAGETESGATVHLVDEVYDRGVPLGQARVPVFADDTAESLAARVLEVEHRLLPAAVLAAAQAGNPVPFEFT